MRCHGRWLLGLVILGCRSDANGGNDGDASEESTAEGGSTTAGPSSGDPSGNPTSDPSTDTGATTDTGPVADTGTETQGEPEFCLTTANIDFGSLAPRDHLGALRGDPSALVWRLVFGGELDGLPYTAVVSSTAGVVDGPWELAQELEGVAPHDIGDIDGDGLDDLVVVDDTGVGAWWAAMPDGTLEPKDVFEVAGDADALVRLPGDLRAAIARVDTELTFAPGIGDGTFGAETPIPTMSADVSWSPPVVAWDVGMMSVGTTRNDCARACEDDTFVLRIDRVGAVTPIGRLRAGDELLDIGDIDDDGALDLLYRDGSDDSLRIHRGGNEEADPPFLELPSNDAAFSDVENDGDIDVFSTQDGQYTIQFNNDDDFASYYMMKINYETPAKLGQGADLDGMGIAEVVLSGNDNRHSLLYTRSCQIGP